MTAEKESKEKYNLNDLSTFELVFNKHYEPLVIYANTFMKDLSESQDIVQHVFVSIWEKRESITIHTSLNGLLYKAVYNTCLNKIKQQKIRMNHAKDVQQKSEISMHSETIQQKELINKIDNAINQLPEQCAKIFKMSRVDDLKYQEIADKLGLSIKTVENQMGKALKHMRVHLKDYLPFAIIFILN